MPDQLEGLLVARAVEAQHPHALGDRVVVGRDRAAVAEGAEVLRREERERRHRAERAGAAAAGTSSRRPARRPRPRARRAPRSRPPAATLPNRWTTITAFVRGVSAARTVSAVTQNVSGSTSQNIGRRARRRDRLGGRVEGERGDDDLVARTDVERTQGERQRVGAVGDADRVARRRGRRRSSDSNALTSGPRMKRPSSMTASTRVVEVSRAAARAASSCRRGGRPWRAKARRSVSPARPALVPRFGLRRRYYRQFSSSFALQPPEPNHGGDMRKPLVALAAAICLTFAAAGTASAAPTWAPASHAPRPPRRPDRHQRRPVHLELRLLRRVQRLHRPGRALRRHRRQHRDQRLHRRHAARRHARSPSTAPPSRARSPTPRGRRCRPTARATPTRARTTTSR